MSTSRWKPAVTVASVIERDGRFLLVEEETREGVRWNQPAGHLEPGESLVDAAIRETLEETAHDFTPCGLLGAYLSPAGERAYLRFAFVGEVGAPRENFALDTGILKAFWASMDEIRANLHLLRHPVTLRCLEDYLERRAAALPWLPLAAVNYLPDEVTLLSDVGAAGG
ncbi:NUDIX hydrolase [Verticiella sediminum]|uniref:Phosphatase NudJ n=1 Tax=Verticiella sediminum TaxID=1247510 RepID=A0A556AXG2_9BURK|nr:NUDIX hydrolase [Verticiella sediminum]TSH97125.1 NUDIX hydrolase [Verticiella sediminum]